MEKINILPKIDQENETCTEFIVDPPPPSLPKKLNWNVFKFTN